MTCVHCGRRIVQVFGAWVDPEAAGDDAIWRETCDAHDTFTAEHEPAAVNRVLTRKCPRCTRLIVEAFDATFAECEYCGWFGSPDAALPIPYEPLPPLAAVDYANDRAVADGFELDGGF